MKQLRAQLAQLVVEALVRAACWLMRAQELPSMPVLPETWEQLSAVQPTWRDGGPEQQLKPKVCNCLECREQRLGQLFVLDGFLAYALKTCRWVGHDVDRRFKQ